MSRIVVLGMFGRSPFGGQTWLYLNWLLGLKRAGHDVWYVEDDSVWPYDPQQNSVTDDCTYAVRHIADCMAHIGMADHWAFRLADRSGAVWGLDARHLDDLYRQCDALFNIVGATDLREEQLRAPFRVYVETDPVTAELRLDQGDRHTREAFANHDVIATYGENYGAPDCGVPLCDIDFIKTRQPIALDFWPMTHDPAAPYFTTIGNYRQDGSDVSWRGDTYFWSKHHEWEKLVTLPRTVNQRFRLALKVDQEDRARLVRHGWDVVPSFDMSLDVFGEYREFIATSRGELTVAKDQNVRLRSGWFSERDVCYLASGKPVIAQDTGFSNVLPTGDGLFSFTSVADAAAAVDAVNGAYRKHCERARELAEEYFDAATVARRLCEEIGLS